MENAKQAERIDEEISATGKAIGRVDFEDVSFCSLFIELIEEFRKLDWRVFTLWC